MARRNLRIVFLHSDNRDFNPGFAGGLRRHGSFGMEAREPRGRKAQTPANAAKFTMACDCMRRRFQGALIGTYKRLILGGNLTRSDFRCWLLHACTGGLQVPWQGCGRKAKESIS